jgi:hypothetical protein
VRGLVGGERTDRPSNVWSVDWFLSHSLRWSAGGGTRRALVIYVRVIYVRGGRRKQVEGEDNKADRRWHSMRALLLINEDRTVREQGRQIAMATRGFGSGS